MTGWIREPRVLDPDTPITFYPELVYERPVVIKPLKKFVFNPLIDQRAWNTYILYGPPGSGKTTLVRYLIDQTEKETIYKKINNVRILYLRLKSNMSLNGIINYLVGYFSEFASIKDPAFAGEKIVETVQNHGLYVLIVLDEIEQLGKANMLRLYQVMHFLNRLKEHLDINKPGWISPLYITNNTRIIKKMPSDLHTDIPGSNYIKCPFYSVPELYDIVKRRAEFSLDPRALIRDKENGIYPALFYMVKYLYNTMGSIGPRGSGLAREAILSLKRSVEIAEAENNPIMKEHVIKAVGDVLSDSIVKELESYGEHGILIIDSLYSLTEEKRKNKKTLYDFSDFVYLPFKVIYDKYKFLCKEYGFKPLSSRQIRRYLEKFEKTLLIGSEVTSKEIKYWILERNDILKPALEKVMSNLSAVGDVLQ